jgi:hypothetical protein
MLEKLRGLGCLWNGELGSFTDSLDTLSENPDFDVSRSGLDTATDRKGNALVNFERFVR